MNEHRGVCRLMPKACTPVAAAWRRLGDATPGKLRAESCSPKDCTVALAKELRAVLRTALKFSDLTGGVVAEPPPPPATGEEAFSLKRNREHRTGHSTAMSRNITSSLPRRASARLFSVLRSASAALR
jgi:hypothetical protein